MEADRTNAALGQTVASLQGGAQLLGIGAAIPAISAWEQTLSSARSPQLVAIADNLAVLRTLLGSTDFDPAEAGRMLQALGEQTRATATSPEGLPVAAFLTQLSLILSTTGGALVAQGSGQS